MLRAFQRSLALACALAAVATASATPGSAELALTGAGPYFSLALPPAVHTLAGPSGLEGLQVMNARGDTLPFAWGGGPTAIAPQEHQTTVALFKLPGTAASGAKGTASRGWVIDLKQVMGNLVRLDLSLPAGTSGVYTLSVEAGDDLQHWRPLQPSAQVMSLQHQGQRLSSTRIDLGGARARYLRLTALPGSSLPELVSAELTSVTDTHAPPMPVQWGDPVDPSQCGESHCDYALPPGLPLSQVEVLLDEPNTLATVDLLGRIDPGEAPPAARHPARHALRHPLRALRHKNDTTEPAAPAPYWEPLATAGVYWLRLPQGEVRSGPLWLPSGDSGHAALRLQTRGPIGLAGARPPRLRLGSHTRSLVFLARGPAPYRLAWGIEPARVQPPIPLAQLLPLRQEGDPLPEDRATLSLPPASSPATVSPGAPASSPVPAAQASRSPLPKYGLWAALLVGLSLMGFMAWSLLRSTPSRANDRASPGAAEPPVNR